MSLGSYEIIIAMVLTGMASETIKATLRIIRFVYNKQRIDFAYLIQAGGFPSTHTAFISALFFSLGFEYGFSSPYAAIGFALLAIVAYDAAGVRREAERHARFINELDKEVKILEKPLKSSVGHTLFEVFAGVIFGALITALVRSVVVA